MKLSDLPEDLRIEVMRRASSLSEVLTLRDAMRASLLHSIEVRRVALCSEHAKGLAGQAACVTLLTHLTLLQLAERDL